MVCYSRNDNKCIGEDVTLGERLRVFETKVLRGIFGPKRDNII
jgi:hypothetical protein